MRELSGLHVIVSGERAIPLARLADELGASVIQLREKHLPTSEIILVADRIRSSISRACFIINDRTDVALAVGADGVHLGQDDLPIEHARALLGRGAIIGVSCGSLKESLLAERAGANYIGFGHMYPTASKRKEMPPRSLKELSEVTSTLSLPVIAIGGITSLNAAPLIEAGASGVAVIGALSGASDPRAAIEAMLFALKQAKPAVAGPPPR